MGLAPPCLIVMGPRRCPDDGDNTVINNFLQRGMRLRQDAYSLAGMSCYGYLYELQTECFAALAKGTGLNESSVTLEGRVTVFEKS